MAGSTRAGIPTLRRVAPLLLLVVLATSWARPPRLRRAAKRDLTIMLEAPGAVSRPLPGLAAGSPCSPSALVKSPLGLRGALLNGTLRDGRGVVSGQGPHARDPPPYPLLPPPP